MFQLHDESWVHNDTKRPGNSWLPERLMKNSFWKQNKHILKVVIIFQASLVAVIVPDPETLPGYAKEKLNLSATMEELCKNQVCFLVSINIFKFWNTCSVVNKWKVDEVNNHNEIECCIQEIIECLLCSNFDPRQVKNNNTVSVY